MEIFVGVGLALAISGFATLSGFDRNRFFYPTMLIVIASWYAVFAVMSGSVHTLLIESLVIVVFIVASILGFKFSLWLIVGGLVAHGVLDSVHGHLIVNPGVPQWWPKFCLTYDLAAAVYLAGLLIRRNQATDRP